MSEKLTVILGGGESGVGAALLAKQKGYKVFLSDSAELKSNFREELQKNKIDFEEGKHSLNRILEASLVIKSPGISEDVDLIQKIRQKRIFVISEIEFAFRYAKSKIIAITGSNGKTTTTLLTYHILKAAGYNVALGGNVGTSFARLVASGHHDWYVLEVSSFQLDGCINFAPDVAVLLNITPDHLDRYDYQFENYVLSKFRIIQNAIPETRFIYFKDDPAIADELKVNTIDCKHLPITLKGSEPKAGWSDGISISIPSKPGYLISINRLPLNGKHNLVNILAAMMAADHAGVDFNSILKGVITFKNAPHRLENVGLFNNITWVNDSKATNVDSVFYALDAFKQPIIWIAGGIDKGNDYSQIEPLVREKVKALICLGTDNTKLKSYFADKILLIYEAQSIEDCIEKCLESSLPGDVILLSPACSSFDLFKNYEDRGNQFRDAVQKLINTQKNVS